jgi:hypothetical protein
MHTHTHMHIYIYSHTHATHEAVQAALQHPILKHTRAHVISGRIVVSVRSCVWHVVCVCVCKCV